MKTLKIALLPLLILLVNVLNGQHSYIIQLKTNQQLTNQNSAQLRSQRSAPIAKQIAKEPMNIWEVNFEREMTNKTINDLFYGEVDIVSIQKNRKVKERSVPNDSLYKNQWQYKNTVQIRNDLDAENAWSIATGGKTMRGEEIVVAVIDDGLALNHPDLQGNLWVNKNEIPNNKIDDDGNGYVDDYRGWNVVAQNDNVTEDASHGTPVTGIIGAKGNNGTGVTGINWDVKLMPVFYGNATESNALASYSYVFSQRKLYNETNGAKGALIVATNASWGIDNGFAEEAPLWCAMYDSLGKVGVLNAGATANANVNVDVDGDLPTSCPSEYLIAVTNVTRNNNKQSSAGYGKKSIDLGAYGEDVYTLTSSNYGSFRGTSAATPHVAGTIALMYAAPCDALNDLVKKDPSKAALYVKDAILNGTTALPGFADNTTSKGILNLTKSINNIMKGCTNCKPPLAIKSETKLTKASISWEPTTAKKLIRYRKDGDTNWTILPELTEDLATINDLSYCTDYEYQVSYVCDNTTADWSYSKYFKSDGCCNSPSGIQYKVDGNNLIIKLPNITSNSKLLINKTLSDKVDTIDFQETTNFELNDCQEYQIRVSSFCDIQNKFSELSNPILISSRCGECSKVYCAPAEYDNVTEWIKSVSFNGVKYTSGRGLGGYVNHTGGVIPKVRMKDSLVMDIEPGFKNSSFREYFFVYVDFNGDGKFSDDEKAFAAKEPVDKISNAKIYIPDNSKPGLTRIRVIMSYSNNQAGCNAKGEFGETEDHCMEILNSVSVKEVKENYFDVNPNPSNGVFTIKTQDIEGEVKFVNQLGKVVHRQYVQKNYENQINSQLPSGFYQIIMERDGSMVSKKIVVQN